MAQLALGKVSQVGRVGSRMTNLRKLQEAMKNADIMSIAQELDLYGECACETMTGLRCKVCGAWTCGACNSDHERWHEQEISMTYGKSMTCQENLTQGQHKCKFHDYEHNYVRHSCGHEYCPYTWLYCPRCVDRDSNNRIDKGIRP